MTSAFFDLLDKILQSLSLLFGLIVVVRLAYLKLYRVYPFFFGFLCVPQVILGVGVAYGVSSKTFLDVYLTLEPVRTVLYILVVWELFSVIFRNYAGLRSLSRWVMGIAAAIAPVGLILTWVASESAVQKSQRALMVLRFERGVAFGLVIFIVIMLYFISRYPIRLPKNAVAHTILYSVWFMGDAALLLAASFMNQHPGIEIVNTGLAILEIGSYIGWTLLLSKEGEFQETRVRRTISPETEQALIGELDAMNAMLLRAGRSMSGRPSSEAARR
jgi:hypothetical protein